MREVEQERLIRQNPTIRAWSGLVEIIIALVVIGLWIG